MTFDLRAEKVTIEGPSAALTKLFEAIHAVAPHLEVRVVPGPPPPCLDEAAPTPPAFAGTIGRQAADHVIETTARDCKTLGDLLKESMDIATKVRAFARRYQPASTVDRIIVLAGYSVSHGNLTLHKDGAFTSQQMQSWFRACGYEAPANMAVALNDAHSKAEVLSRLQRNRWMINDAGLSRLHLMERKALP